MAVKLAVEKGASSWLTAIPVDEYGFALHKSAFIALRYGWLPLRTPANCACGTSFSVEHPSLWNMPCPVLKVGYPQLGTTK